MTDRIEILAVTGIPALGAAFQRLEHLAEDDSERVDIRKHAREPVVHPFRRRIMPGEKPHTHPCVAVRSVHVSDFLGNAEIQ